MNHGKENKIIHYSLRVTNKRNKTLSYFFFVTRRLIKTLHYTNPTHYKEFITVFINLYLRMKKLSYIFSCTKQDVYTFLFVSFVCLVVILHILCVIPHWDSAIAHSPSGKKLNPSSQENARFSGRCTLAYNFHFILCLPHWDSATAHSPSGKELNPSSREKSCFAGLIVL